MYVELLPTFDSSHTGEIFDTLKAIPNYKGWAKSWTWKDLITGWNKKYFKSSNKEAYDAQNRVNSNAKFKVGDRVEIISNKDNFSGHQIGYSFIIKVISRESLNYCREDTRVLGVSENSLKLVSLKANTGKFKVGDIVRVTRVAKTYEHDWQAGWVSIMDNSVNETFEIVEDRNNLGYRLENSFLYPEFILELVGSKAEESMLDKWLRETKAKNLSLRKLGKYIEWADTCPFNDVYKKLKGYDPVEKATILYDKWHSTASVRNRRNGTKDYTDTFMNGTQNQYLKEYLKEDLRIKTEGLYGYAVETNTRSKKVPEIEKVELLTSKVNKLY
jgi:hypothetical protein